MSANKESLDRSRLRSYRVAGGSGSVIQRVGCSVAPPSPMLLMIQMMKAKNLMGTSLSQWILPPGGANGFMAGSKLLDLKLILPYDSAGF